ncbi:MAG: flagellin, partial [Alphaproteobacteria bacterium]|nr:flagellin [Alphaproteobacteria bacterium]
MTVINTNVGALQARTYAVRADGNVTKAMERLSSGLRINSAADDAAGLAVANKMESQIRGMNMAIRNSQDGISLVQTAESAMGEINNMVIRMRELAVQMNNGVYTDTDRANAQLEVTALLAEIDKVATNSAFNQVKILDGTYSQDIRAGNTNPEVINVTIDRMNTDSLGGGRVATGETKATLATVAHVVAGVDTTLAAGSNTAKHFNTTITATEGRP